MSTTAQQVFEQTMSIADELSSNGTINASDTNDYKYRVTGILNLLQSELIRTGEMYSTYEISHKPSEVAVGSFDVAEYTGASITKEGKGKAYAYYLEVDGEGTIYIEDYTGGWNVIATISVPSTVTKFTAYSGILTPTTGATKCRFRFEGTYRYLVKNYALFTAPVQASRVPAYRPFYEAQMPSDFKSIDQIVNEESRSYNRQANYKWEGKNKLYIDWLYEGNIRIVYRPIPTLLTAITDTLQLDDVTCRTVLPYGLGMELYKDENVDLYNHFKLRYEQLKREARINEPANELSIQSVYGGFDAG